MDRRSKPDLDYISKEQESCSGSEKTSDSEKVSKMENMLKKVLLENQQLKTAVLFLKQQQSKEKDYHVDDCKRSKEKLLTEIGSLLTEIAFLKEVREQLRYKDPESRKETTKALTETIQAKLEVAHAKIEAAEAKKETLEAQKRAEEAKETAEAAQAREDNLLSYVSKIATLAYQQAAEAEYDSSQARKAMAVAEAMQGAAFADNKVRRSHKHHPDKHHRGHRNHGECRCHHSHHSHHSHRSHYETQSDLPNSEPETLSSHR
ncbi:uncharacterized protein LOC143834413 isoform X2 [Paroedura picta]